jgi:penicillin-binding protein 1A
VNLNGRTIYQARSPVVCETCNTPGTADPTVEEPKNLEDLFAADTASVIAAERVIDERNAYIMNTMLQDVIRFGTGRRARVLERGDLAGKTGTTNEAADTWFNGYNPDVVTTVWVGFPDHQPLGAREYGGNTPLPIWIEFMARALAGKPEKVASLPPGVVTMKIDRESGELATPQQADAIFELFLAEHPPVHRTDAAATGPGSDTEEYKPVDIF